MKKNPNEKPVDKALSRLKLFEKAREIPPASETGKNEKNPKKDPTSFPTKNKKDAKPERRNNAAG